jgi:hypothetical protein
MITLIVVVAVAVLVLLTLALAVRIVRQYEQGVVFRLRRLRGSRGLGLAVDTVAAAASEGGPDGGKSLPSAQPGRRSASGLSRLLGRPGRRQGRSALPKRFPLCTAGPGEWCRRGSSSPSSPGFRLRG